jgi:squalene cyclase
LSATPRRCWRRARRWMVRQQDDDIEWDVLADPEGNEFCVFIPE